MKFRRFRRCYHDARLLGFDLDPAGKSLTLTVEMCACCSEGGGIARISLNGVRNISELATYLSAAKPYPATADDGDAFLGWRNGAAAGKLNVVQFRAAPLDDCFDVICTRVSES